MTILICSGKMTELSCSEKALSGAVKQLMMMVLQGLHTRRAVR